MIEFDMNWNGVYDIYDNDDYFLLIFYRNFWKLHFILFWMITITTMAFYTTFNSCKFAVAELGTRDRNATECVVSGHVDNASQL